MNERIQELAEQAGFSKDKYDLYWDDDANAEGVDLERFAELIVRECARIARATPCSYEEDEVRQRLGHTWDMASLEAGHEIVKHFGVEE